MRPLPTAAAVQGELGRFFGGREVYRFFSKQSATILTSSLLISVVTNTILMHSLDKNGLSVVV